MRKAEQEKVLERGHQLLAELRVLFDKMYANAVANKAKEE